MPIKTARARRAMHAAAEGRGRIGIPKKVAKEMIRADKSSHGSSHKSSRRAAPKAKRGSKYS